MIDLITKIDLFSKLDDKILKKLSGACIMRPFTRNETIVRQGETGLGLYLIVKGRVKVDREQGGVRLQVAELGPEQFFGEMSLLDSKPRAATVTAIEDSECVLLTRDSFIKLMNKFPEIPISVARVLAERLRVANEKVAVAAPAPFAGTPASARKAETALAAVPSTPNGASPAVAAPNGTKAQIHSKVLETFQSLYTIKALSRFSVAILGCPVEGTAANTVDQIRVGDVKALVFPADEPVDMQIATQAPGWFTLDVFTPFSVMPIHFGPVAVEPGDQVHMTVISGGVTLHHSEKIVPFL
jgi:CRP-like cAMP-binding protein